MAEISVELLFEMLGRKTASEAALMTEVQMLKARILELQKDGAPSPTQ